MSRPTLSLCMIVRDVAPFIERCLGSVIDEIDELVIVDTGSKDETLEVIRDLAKMRSAYRPLQLVIAEYTPDTNPEGFLHDVPETFENLPNKIAPPPAWAFSGQQILANFGAARQKGWELATSDYIMWIDSDDIVAGAKNIHPLITKMRDEKIDTAILTYDYDQDEEERSTCQLLRARITRRGGPAKWMHPIHEVLGPFGESRVFGEVLIHHIARKLEKEVQRTPLRNYKVLVKSFMDSLAKGEDPHPRMYFYLANESRGWNMKGALEFFAQYIGKSDWAEEKCLAHVYSGQLLEGEGDWRKAQAHYAAATTIFENKPEAHFGLARIAYYLKDWKNCIHHHERGRIALAAALDVLHYNPFDRRYFPAICASQAYLELGNPRRALRIIEEGLAQAPKDLSLLGARERAIDMLARQQRKLHIILYIGGSVEPWGPRTPYERGIGGSETAAVHIAKALAARGHRVQIFCECQGNEGTHDGVEYIHFTKFKPEEMADVFVASRRPLALINTSARARLRVLWLHDNHCGPAVIENCEGLLAADLIMPVSKWHRDYTLKRYPFLDPRKVIPTRNGIDPTLFQVDQPAKKNKLIFSSSADRGLIIALDYFKEVRAQVPDAELHVFYGFETVTKMIEQGYLKTHDADEVLEQIADLKRRAENTEGVFLRGRVGQETLAKEFLESKVWFYPTWFEESSCISAMEAQAAGCTPVTTALAALVETVHHGFLLKPPCTSQAYKEAFIKRVVWCLTREKERSAMATVGRENALSHHPWSNVAEEWETLFCEQLAQSRV
jgi:glycosyltransferase involved in cell wall biosynthesis